MNLNILILDDEKRITEELAEFLTRKKYQVYQANEAAQAEKILNSCFIDILTVSYTHLTLPTKRIV